LIDLYYWPTPNGWKITIALEELELPYAVKPVNIGRGEQFAPGFLAISPNNRMPAIVDHAPIGGGAPLSIFESGAILLYLAEKTGALLPKDPGPRYDAIQWLMWQMGGLGPMLGQAHHFRQYAPEKIDYAVNRYTDEANRLYGVLNQRLEGRDYVCGDFSIVDCACWPWIVPYKRQGQELEAFPNIHAWHERMKVRPAVQRGMSVGAELRATGGMDDKAKEVLFGQRAR